jgi:hypothetical protein
MKWKTGLLADLKGDRHKLDLVVVSLSVKPGESR